MDRELRTLNFPQPTRGFLGTGQITNLIGLEVEVPSSKFGEEARGFLGTGQITNFPIGLEIEVPSSKFGEEAGFRGQVKSRTSQSASKSRFRVRSSAREAGFR